MKKIISSVIIIVIDIFGAGGYYAYHQLQPKNYLKNVPTLSKSGDQKNPRVKMKENVFNILLLGSDARKGQNVGTRVLLFFRMSI